MAQDGDKPRLLFDSVILGIVGGLSAQLFMWMLRLAERLLLADEAAAELHIGREPCLEGRGVAIEFMAVKREAGFEA